MPTYVRTALIASALYLTACASTPEKLQGADYYYAEGQKAYEKKRCVEASEHFQRLVSNFPGSQRVTESQYMLAESYFCSEDYVNAAFEYQRLIDIYPASNWASEAQFKIGESFFEQMRRPELDQKETYEALTSFRNFIEDNPGSPLVETARERIRSCRENLAEKIYLGAYLPETEINRGGAYVVSRRVARLSGYRVVLLHAVSPQESWPGKRPIRIWPHNIGKKCCRAVKMPN